MTRKRNHIPLIELLASALADKLTAPERDYLRRAQWPSERVVALFTPDHIRLHCWGGEDLWWNIDMRRRGPELKAKDRADTTRAAKAKRIDDKWQAFLRAVAEGRAPLRTYTPWPQVKRKWPKRKLRT